MSLFNKKNLDKIHNPYNITENDINGKIEGFPVGVVVRMMEEQELQGNKPDIRVFQKRISVDKIGGGFNWRETDAGIGFWMDVIRNKKFELFFEKYSEYEIYN